MLRLKDTLEANIDGNATKAGTIWTAVTQGQKWSRICMIVPKASIEGLSGMLSISCTRNAVVCNYTFLVNSSHSSQCSIIQINGTKYSNVRIRGLANNGGSIYIELYDTASSIASGTTQAWHCSWLPLLQSTITIYTAFTDGTTIPSGYTVSSDFTTSAQNRTITADITGTAERARRDSDGNVINTTYLKRSGGTMTGTINWSDASSGTITEHNLLYVAGSTDGGFISYGSPSAGDAGRLRIGTNDDSNATLSLGNTISGTYNEALRIQNGNVTIPRAIISSVTSTTHIAGNKGTAIINSTASGTNYNMLFKMNSRNGYWTMGSWNTDYCLFYTAKSVVDAGTNSFTKKLMLLNETGNSVFPGTITAGGFNGPLTGNATSATTASKITQGSSSSSVADNQLVFWIES